MARIDEVRERYESITEQLYQNKETFAEYLKFAGRFFKMPTAQTMTMFATNPKATMVADYDTWQRFGRQVQRGTNSIAVLDGSGLKHYFDISQTAGGRPPYQWTLDKQTAQEFIALWQFTISYLRDEKGLHNLIWAYSPDMIHLNSRDAYLEYWPGDEWVDILGLDAYDRNGADYDHKGLQMIRLMKNIAYTKNKPLALTETGLENNNPEESNYYNKKWWTSMLYKIIENEPVSFVLLWRNGDFPTNGGHYFSAFRGCYSEKDFMDFSRKDQILFEDDLPDMYKPLK